MKNVLSLLILLPVLSACSDDFSDCEKIGHERGTYIIADCQNIEIECESGDEEYCANIPDKSTEQGCKDFIAYLNKITEEKRYVLRCPLTDSRIAKKTLDESFVTTTLEYVYNDGSDINFSELLNDTNNIYIFSTFQEGKYNYIKNYDVNGYYFMKYNK